MKALIMNPNLYAASSEHALLESRLVDTDRTATELGTIQNEVISIGTNLREILFLVAVEQVEVLRLRRCERMVHRIETLCLVIPFKQREIHDPERCEHLRIPESQTVGHLHTENAEHGLSLSLRTAKNQDEVAGLGACSLCHFLHLFRSIEFVN